VVAVAVEVVRTTTLITQELMVSTQRHKEAAETLVHRLTAPAVLRAQTLAPVVVAGHTTALTTLVGLAAQELLLFDTKLEL